MSDCFDSRPLLVLIMGPTASGKTELAMALCDRLPADIISVDSALVYRQMNIGTAKPDSEELRRYPHRLIDVCDPAEAFSVADFCRLAEAEISAIVSAGRIPILVGGTMMYFKALLDGLADMPETHPELRAAIAREAEEKGWPALHRELRECDPEMAKQIHPNHSQRISRALEVYRSSGKTMTQFRREQSEQEHTRLFANRYRVLQVALLPNERATLHQRIEKRFKSMLERGFVEEVQALFQRDDLHLDLPSMRAVGYRQLWQYLQGDFDYDTMVEKGLAATRQLAKRQLTWLRDWPDLVTLPMDEALEKNQNEGTLEKNVEYILNFLATKSL